MLGIYQPPKSHRGARDRRWPTERRPKVSMTLADRLYQAGEFGKHAAATGKIRAFSLDRRAAKLAPGKDDISLAVTKAWYAGYDQQDQDHKEN